MLEDLFHSCSVPEDVRRRHKAALLASDWASEKQEMKAKPLTIYDCVFIESDAVYSRRGCNDRRDIASVMVEVGNQIPPIPEGYHRAPNLDFTIRTHDHPDRVWGPWEVLTRSQPRLTESGAAPLKALS